MVAEEARQGKDVATLEVVMEAASPLMCGQLEGMGVLTGQAHRKVAGSSHPSMAVVV